MAATPHPDPGPSTCSRWSTRLADLPFFASSGHLPAASATVTGPPRRCPRIFERPSDAAWETAGLLPDLLWAASDAIRDGSAPTPTTPTWCARYDADLPAFLRWYLPGTGPAAVSRRRGRPDRLRRTQVTAGPLKGGRGGNQFLAYSKALRSQS